MYARACLWTNPMVPLTSRDTTLTDGSPLLKTVIHQPWCIFLWNTSKAILKDKRSRRKNCNPMSSDPEWTFSCSCWGRVCLFWAYVSNQVNIPLHHLRSRSQAMMYIGKNLKTWKKVHNSIILPITLSFTSSMSTWSSGLKVPPLRIIVDQEVSPHSP